MLHLVCSMVAQVRVRSIVLLRVCACIGFAHAISWADPTIQYNLDARAIGQSERGPALSAMAHCRCFPC